MEKMQKLNLRMQKLNFPGTHWRGVALIGAQKKNPEIAIYCAHDPIQLVIYWHDTLHVISFYFENVNYLIYENCQIHKTYNIGLLWGQNYFVPRLQSTS